MAGPDLMESRPPKNVDARPSPPEERPSQRTRREEESQLSLYGHRHFVSHPPFTPLNSPRSVPYGMLGQDAHQVDIGQAAGSGAMPANESIHDTSQTDPSLSKDELIDQQVDQLIASCGPIRKGAFDNLGAILASYLPGYSGGTGLDANGSGNPTQQFRGAPSTTPQMATRQSAEWSRSEGVSASSSSSLPYTHYSNVQADPYHFDQSLRPESGSFTQHGFANIPPPIVGPSTANYTSTPSHSQSRSISYHSHDGSGTYNPPDASGTHNPPDTSSMARSLSTSDIPSMAPVPGDFSGLPASASDASTYAQPQYASTAGQIASVNARPYVTRAASGIKTSNARVSHEVPPSAESIPSLSGPGMTRPVPALDPPPSLSNSTPMQPVSSSIGHDLHTEKATESSAGGPSGGPRAEGCADQERTTLKEDTEWIDKSAALTALAKVMRSTCKVPNGIERARAFRGLRYLFTEMFELCYNDDHGPNVDRLTVSHLSRFR